MAYNQVVISDNLGQPSGLLSNPFVVGLKRANEVLSLNYANSVDPSGVIDKRGYAMVCVGPIPVAANGLTMTPLAAQNGLGAGLSIPYFLDSGTKTAFYGVVVATGEIWTLQPEIAAIPFFGLRFSGAWTGSIPVWLVG